MKFDFVACKQQGSRLTFAFVQSDQCLCYCYLESIIAKPAACRIRVIPLKGEATLSNCIEIQINEILTLMPNKKICVFWVTGLKILGMVGTQIFFNSFFFWKKI